MATLQQNALLSQHVSGTDSVWWKNLTGGRQGGPRLLARGEGALAVCPTISGI